MLGVEGKDPGWSGAGDLWHWTLWVQEASEASKHPAGQAGEASPSSDSHILTHPTNHMDVFSLWNYKFCVSDRMSDVCSS